MKTICWTSAVSLSMFSHLLKGTRLTPVSELLRFLLTLVYPTTLIHPLQSPPHTIPEPSELVSPSWSSWLGPHKNNAAHLPSWSWLVSFSASLLLRSPASSLGDLSLYPLVRLLASAWCCPPSWGWETPPLLLYCVPAGPGGFVLPEPLWPPAKRKQNAELKASL